jgi:NADPH:quinone reductase-like Zn-dependent oxidoreductase
MRAVVHDRYGPPEVLRVDEVARPVPKDNEVLVRIRAATVNRTDCHVRAANPFLWRFIAGFRRPKWRILGMEFAGEVEAVGGSVPEFNVGDHVVGIRAYLNEGFGANAELICANPARLALKPASATWEEAAALFDGSLAALSGLRAANVDKGRSVLVYGASGSIGTAAVQLAKYFEADVTAVCNTKNVELVKSLGADRVLDYTREDFTRSGERYDVVFDAVGKKSFRQCRRSLNPGGIYLPTDGLLSFALAPLTSRFGDRKVLFSMPRYTKDNLLFVRELVEEGKYRPVIDRTYPFEQVVEATKYVETGQKTGNVILTLDGARPTGA